MEERKQMQLQMQMRFDRDRVKQLTEKSELLDAAIIDEKFRKREFRHYNKELQDILSE